MKLKRLMMASALCLTLSAAPSAFACEHGSGWLFSLFHHCDGDRGQDKGGDRGNGNSRGGGNDRGGQCSRSGGSSGGGSTGGSSTGGSSTGSGSTGSGDGGYTK